MHHPDRPPRPSHAEHLADLRRRAEELLLTTGSELQAVPIADLEELLHELRVHHAELELQNDELRGASSSSSFPVTGISSCMTRRRWVMSRPIPTAGSQTSTAPHSSSWEALGGIWREPT